MIKKLLIVILLTGVALSVFVHQQFKVMQQEPLRAQTALYEVNAGTGFHRLCRDWQKRGFLQSCLPYQIYSKFLPERFELKAGVYDLSNLTVMDAIDKIHNGKQQQFSFTIIEGETFKDILEKLKTSPYLQVSDNDDELIAALEVDNKPEGWFLPETYHYEAYTRAATLLNRAKQKMLHILEQAWESRAPELPLKSSYEVLILASIIEKETGYAPERQKIASVFVNRLKANMRLQTDPTVIYGIGDKFDGDIKRRDLKQYTPYNTYRIKGLPPTPIAMPSADAVRAATQPAQTPYYYFVAKGNGQHQFSINLREHNQAVQRYILKRNNDS